jgi:preprotein translocase SecE subunit
MAVAVKTSPGARSSGTSGGLVVYSFAGVVYLLATIAIVFKGLPTLWWSVWEGGQVTVVGATILVLLELAAAAGLLWGGARLLGKKPIPGVRAGVFVGFAGLLVVLALTRWAGRWFEDYAYTSHGIEPQTGAILTGVVGGLLLAAWVYAFTRPGFQRGIVKLEEGGWFHASTYKSNQGRVVRRGTMVGILLLVGAGIYSMMHGGTLRRGPSDWALTVPFTGKVAVEHAGDARPFLADPAYVPASAKTQVQIKWTGDDPKLATGQVISADEFEKRVLAALERAQMQVKDGPEKDRLFRTKEKVEEAAKGDVVDYLLALNKAVYAEFEAVVPRPDQPEAEPAAGNAGFHTDIRRRLYEVARGTGWDDLSKLMAAVRKEAETAKKTDAAVDPGWMASIPEAVPVIDRAALEKANAQADKKVHVIVGLKRGSSPFALPEGKVVSTEEFDAEEKRVYLGVASRELDKESPAQKKLLDALDSTTNGADFRKRLRELIEESANDQLKSKLQKVEREIAAADDVGERGVPLLVPRREALTKATGTVLYTNVPLLPAVQFTLPLLLLAVGIWFAWRAVNLPMFADFLIATEAEMNKVSWTTQKRLVQDTIVVLVTVVLMAVFLFSMDVMWKKVLSWKHIGVLHIPDRSDETKKSITEKKW